MFSFQAGNQCQESYIKMNPLFKDCVRALRASENETFEFQEESPPRRLKSCLKKPSEEKKVEELKEPKPTGDETKEEEKDHKTQEAIPSTTSSSQADSQDRSSETEDQGKSAGRMPKRLLMKNIYQIKETALMKIPEAREAFILNKMLTKIPSEPGSIEKRTDEWVTKEIEEYKLGSKAYQDAVPKDLEKVATFVSKTEFNGTGQTHSFKFTNPSQRCFARRSFFEANALKSYMYSTFKVGGMSIIQQSDIVFRKETDAMIKAMFRNIVFRTRSDSTWVYETLAFSAESILLKDLF